MSKVMTNLNPLRLRHSGRLVGEVRVVTTGEKSPHHWQSCRLAHWQWLVFSTWIAISFERGCHRFSIIESWPDYLSYTFMTGRSPLQGWILCFLQRPSHRLQEYPMWVRCGQSANGWIWYTLSHMSGLHMCITCQGTFLLGSSEQSM